MKFDDSYPYDIDPFAFTELRKTARMSERETACMLGVTTRTLRNWELGKARVPYSAYRLLRVIVGAQLPAPGWAGWTLRPGVLIAPNGHTFTAWQLEYLQWVFAAARLWLADYQRKGHGGALAKPGNVTALYNRAADPASSLLTDKPRRTA